MCWNDDAVGSLVGFTATYNQHNAALKWLRSQFEDWDDPFSTKAIKLPDHFLQMPQIIKGSGMAWAWDETKTVSWHWHELVCQLQDEDIALVCGGVEGRSGGITKCCFRWRPNSYDHQRHNAMKETRGFICGNPKVRLPLWDFVLIRDDSTGIRLHPSWGTTKVTTFELGGHTAPVEPPAKGLGKSDGPGTFQKYVKTGQTGLLRFDPAKKPGWRREAPAKPAKPDQGDAASQSSRSGGIKVG